ncbi:MAG: N-acetylmuramoyl-L-alanine amidase [Verrucomicrobiaceae bacterium]|nr:N-acetylmuramoyl-L-alanine amidase [Verrucomicrobiaceae bacterium]
MASIIPLLSASGLTDSSAFHRLKFEPSAAATHTPQFRVPDINKVPMKNAVVSPTAAAAVNFSAPRTAWKHLSPAVRAQVDASLAQHRDWQRIVLHGSGSSHGNAKLMDRYDVSVRGMEQGSNYHFIIGNGAGAQDGLIETSRRWAQAGDASSCVSVCLVGDFNEQAPSNAQMEAVDELMDYLSIKLGQMELSPHSAAKGSVSSCLGTKFPCVETLLKK